MAISFHFEDTPTFPLEKKKISQWLRTIGQQELKTIDTINIIICSDNYLLALNTQYLQHNTLTDIITFPYENKGTALTGDIFISIERIRENASLYKNSEQEELLRVIAHGILHLIGYKDKTANQKKEMKAKEDEALLIYQDMFHVKH